MPRQRPSWKAGFRKHGPCLCQSPSPATRLIRCCTWPGTIALGRQDLRNALPHFPAQVDVAGVRLLRMGDRAAPLANALSTQER